MTAAICVHDPHERLVLLDLLDSCQEYLQWPMKSLRKELELDYSKHAFHDLMEPGKRAVLDSGSVVFLSD